MLLFPLQCSVTVFSPSDDELESNPSPERGGSSSKEILSGGKGGATTAENSSTATTTTTTAVESLSFDVTVRYVRREIRDLTDRDREIFFNAISVLQRVPSAVGREIYGENYYSKDYMNRLHFYGGEREREIEICRYHVHMMRYYIYNIYIYMMFFYLTVGFFFLLWAEPPPRGYALRWP